MLDFSWNSVQIRRAFPGDAKPLWSVRRESLLNVDRRIYSDRQIHAWIHDFSPAGLRRSLRRRSESAYVAHIGGKIAGYGSLAIHGRPHLWALYVNPRYSGMGIGSLLLDTIESAAKAAGYHDLHTTASLAAQPFYRSRGFLALDAFPISIPVPGGAGPVELNMVHMFKFL